MTYSQINPTKVGGFQRMDKQKGYKIYKNSEDLLKAIKKSPKNNILIFDEADLFPKQLKELRAKNDKQMLKEITRIIDFYKIQRGYGYHIKGDMMWDKFRKKVEKRIKRKEVKRK